MVQKQHLWQTIKPDLVGSKWIGQAVISKNAVKK